MSRYSGRAPVLPVDDDVAVGLRVAADGAAPFPGQVRGLDQPVTAVRAMPPEDLVAQGTQIVLLVTLVDDEDHIRPAERGHGLQREVFRVSGPDPDRQHRPHTPTVVDLHPRSGGDPAGAVTGADQRLRRSRSPDPPSARAGRGRRVLGRVGAA